MGSGASKGEEEDEGLPARYARGYSSSEFHHIHHSNYQILENQPEKVKVENQSSGNSLVGTVTPSYDRISNPSQRLLPNSVKKYDTPQRLQSRGAKQKSYLDSLVELRRKNEKEGKEGLLKKVAEGRKVLKNPCSTPSMPKFGENPTESAEECGLEFIGSGDTALDRRIGGSMRSDELSIPDHERDPTPFWMSFSEFSIMRKSSCDTGSLKPNNCLLNVRSDVTVVPFELARSRFEVGHKKKKDKKNENFRQLEELGLGYWHNDVWVPTKVITQSIWQTVQEKLSSRSDISTSF